MTIQLRTSLFSQQGIARDNNEDCVRVRNMFNERHAILCLCDGIGGLEDGEVASEIVANMITKKIHHRPQETLFKRINAANKKISSRIKRCGCTVSAAFIDKLTHKFIAINIGDSRIYFINNDSMHLISKGDDSLNKYNIQNNILLNAVGIKNTLQSHNFICGELNNKDSLIMLSDGAYSKLNENDIKYFNISKNTEEFTIRLANHAVLRQSTDDISIITCKASTVKS